MNSCRLLFSDQILASELDEISVVKIDHPRVRRDDKSDEAQTEMQCRRLAWKRMKLCCGEEMIKAFHEENKELKRNCFKEIMGNKPESLPKPPSELDPLNCDEINKHREQIRVSQIAF